MQRKLARFHFLCEFYSLEYKLHIHRDMRITRNWFMYMLFAEYAFIWKKLNGQRRTFVSLIKNFYINLCIMYIIKKIVISI